MIVIIRATGQMPEKCRTEAREEVLAGSFFQQSSSFSISNDYHLSHRYYHSHARHHNCQKSKNSVAVSIFVHLTGKPGSRPNQRCQYNTPQGDLLSSLYHHYIITILQQFAERRVLLKQVLGAQHDYGNTHFRFPGSNLDPPPLPPGMMLR